MSNKKGISINLSAIAWITFIVFLILKLTNVIAWSWWLVCLPLLIWVGAVIIALIILGIIMLALVIVVKKAAEEDEELDWSDIINKYS